MPDRLPFQIFPLRTGTCRLGENHVLGDEFSDENRIEFALYAFLVDGGPGRRALIDLGPVGLDYLNSMFRRYSLFRDIEGTPDDIRQPDGNVFDWLDRLELQPEDINHLILTHFHADHHGLTTGKDGGALMGFPKATIHVSRVGWEDNLAKRTEDGQWASYVDFGLSDFLLEAEQEGRVRFHDDDEVMPGLDIIQLGGHAPCSQGVIVQTSVAPAIVTSDEIYRYDLLERAIMARISTTPEKLKAATHRLVDLALEGAILLPCHEPMLAKQFNTDGNAWLKGIKPHSDRAARSYQTHAGTRP